MYGTAYLELCLEDIANEIRQAGIREKLELSSLPEPMKGVPIAFIIAGILALAFGCFNGMI